MEYKGLKVKETGYAYRDKYGLVHIVSNKTIAEKTAANGKIAEVEFPNRAGVPFVYTRQGWKGIYDYGDEIYLGHNRGGRPDDINDPIFIEYMEEVREKL